MPLKEHSERIPKKNLREFNGDPLFLTVLKRLLESNYIEKVVINTDSEIIASIAVDFDKVIIHKRPDKIKGDYVSMNKIIQYDINNLEEIHFLQTHSTNPLLKTKTIDDAISYYFDNLKLYDSLFSVTKYHSRFYYDSASPINHNTNELIRTQDLKPVYEENSNLYIFSKFSFIKAGNNRIGLNPFFFEIPNIESIDIDEEEDFHLAEMIYKSNYEH